jgi:uncharacterized protein
LTLAASALWPLDVKTLTFAGYTTDLAGALTEPERAALNRYLGAVERSTGAQVALVTLRSLEGEDIADFANSLYRHWGVGQKGKDEGLLLLLVTDDRRSRIEVGYGLEGTIPDGFAGLTLREMRPALRQRDYATALTTAAQAIGQRIAAEKGVTIQEGLPQRRTSPDPGIPGPAAILIAVVALFILASLFGGGGGGRRGFRRGYSRGGWIPPVVFPSGGWGGRGGHSGGGGFGGYDSSGGFGGFGGGDSGGGGASGDW